MTYCAILFFPYGELTPLGSHLAKLPVDVLIGKVHIHATVLLCESLIYHIHPTSMFATTNTQGTIVDSGTTLAYLTEQAYDSFVNAIVASASSSVRSVPIPGGNECFVTSSRLFRRTAYLDESFPSVALNFKGGASLSLNPKDYLLQQGVIVVGDEFELQDKKEDKETEGYSSPFKRLLRVIIVTGWIIANGGRFFLEWMITH